MNLIPTFKVGERVRIHNRSIEYRCPNCGCGPAFYDRLPEVFETVIILTENEAARAHCHNCFYIFRVSGWYTVKAPQGFSDCGVPYPLIEVVKGEQDEDR